MKINEWWITTINPSEVELIISPWKLKNRMSCLFATVYFTNLITRISNRWFHRGMSRSTFQLCDGKTQRDVESRKKKVWLNRDGRKKKQANETRVRKKWNTVLLRETGGEENGETTRVRVKAEHSAPTPNDHQSSRARQSNSGADRWTAVASLGSYWSTLHDATGYF